MKINQGHRLRSADQINYRLEGWLALRMDGGRGGGGRFLARNCRALKAVALAECCLFYWFYGYFYNNQHSKLDIAINVAFMFIEVILLGLVVFNNFLY